MKQDCYGEEQYVYVLLWMLKEYCLSYQFNNNYEPQEKDRIRQLSQFSLKVQSLLNIFSTKASLPDIPQRGSNCELGMQMPKAYGRLQQQPYNAYLQSMAK